MTTVLHIITGLGSGGAERMLTLIALANQGAKAPRQIVVSLMDEGIHGRVLRDAGIELHSLGVRRAPPPPQALLRLAMILRTRKPDVVMTWLYHADLMGTVAAVLAGLGTERLIWNLRCSEMDFSRYHRTTRWAVSMLVRLSGRPAVVALNSEAGRRAHAALGYRPKRWAYLPNGFNLDEWRADAADRAAVRSELGLDDETTAVCMVARVDPQKDHSTFLAAAERLLANRARFRLVLIGKGTESLPVPAPLGERVHALGERGDVQRLLRGLDIAVVSSRYGEGFPNAVGEAMATEVPCVATDIGDAARVAGEAGRIVPPRAPDAMAAAITEIIGEPREVRMRRARIGRQRIREEFSIERVSGLYRDLWSSVAEQVH